MRMTDKMMFVPERKLFDTEGEKEGKLLRGSEAERGKYIQRNSEG